MTQRSVTLAIASILMLAWCGGCSRSPENKPTPERVRVGAVLPLTGSAANYGELMRRGILLALDEIKANPGKSNDLFDVAVEDSRSMPKDGVSALQKLLAVEKTPAVMPALSSIILACVPIAEQKDVVVLNCPANSPKLRGAGPLVFNLYLLSDQESKALALHAYNKMRARNAGVTFVNNDSGRGYCDSFSAEFAKLGGKVNLADGHDQGTTDFRTTIQKFKAAGVDLVFICSYYAESALFIKQSQELGFQPKWLSYSSVETPEFLKIAGEAAEGLVYSQPGFDVGSTNQLTQNFLAAYKKRFTQDPDLWSAQYYDGTLLLASAVASGARTGKDIQTYLARVRDFPGVTGPITFDSQGCISREVRFKVVSSGRFRPLEE